MNKKAYINYYTLGIVIIAVFAVGYGVYYYFPQLFTGDAPETVEDLTTMTIKDKEAAASFAKAQDENPNLRNTIPSNLPKSGICLHEDKPAQIYFNYEITKKYDDNKVNVVLSNVPPFSIFMKQPVLFTNPYIKPDGFVVSQNILELFTGNQGMIEIYASSDGFTNPESKIYYYLPQKITIPMYQDVYKSQGHLSYKVPDNNCDGKLDPHNVIITLCAVSEYSDNKNSNVFDNSITRMECIEQEYLAKDRKLIEV